MDRPSNPDIQPDSGPLTGEGVRMGALRNVPGGASFWQDENDCAPCGPYEDSPSDD
jgi:hypothetical protein